MQSIPNTSKYNNNGFTIVVVNAWCPEIRRRPQHAVFISACLRNPLSLGCRLHTAPSGANTGVVQCTMLRVHEGDFRRQIIKTETSNCVKEV